MSQRWLLAGPASLSVAPALQAISPFGAGLASSGAGVAAESHWALPTVSQPPSWLP